MTYHKPIPMSLEDLVEFVPDAFALALREDGFASFLDPIDSLPLGS